MKKNKILKALIVAALITGVYGTVNAETGNIVDITINQQHEKTGIELGENSYARGEGSITTGINSIAIGKKATATGGNESHESITQKLQENEQKLQEIEAKKANIQKLSKELNDLKIKEHDVIEAGIRVEQIRKSKEKAKDLWNNAELAWKNKRDGSQAALNDYQKKIDDLNSRLTGVSKLTNSDISSPEGLGKAAKELKGIVEKDTTLNLSIDFYKDYVNNYYKALGDLRLKNKIYNNIESGNVKIIDFIKENPLKADMSDIVIQYEYSSSSNSANSSSSNSFNSASSNSTYTSSSSYYSSSSDSASAYSYNSLGEYSIDENGIARINGLRVGGKQAYNGEIYQTYWNVKTDICDQATYNKWNTAKEDWKKQIKDANKRSGSEVFGKFDTLTGGKSTILFNMVTDMKFELVDLDYQICHYQWQYERTRNNKWLDKKREALEKRKQKLDTNEQTIKNKYKELFHKDLSDTIKLFYVIGKDFKENFKKNEIDSIEQKNKITINKLTSDLERELGINKNAIQEYEKQIKELREKADQAKQNYEGLNPSEEDLILSREYERVAKELEEKANKLKKESEELENLQKNLTLNDLKNKGSDAIAYGTNALATGKASIAFGKDTIVTGEKSVAIGADNKITGANTFVLGTNIVSNAENAVILGKDSVGENNTVSVGAKGKERRIINVGDPTQNTDAVNLQYMKKYVSNNASKTNVDSDSDNKADKDAGNIEISKWQTKLGDGKNEAGNTGLITGGTLNKALEGKADKTYVDGELNKKADKSDLDKKADKDAGNIEISKWQTKLGDGKNEAGNTGLITGGTLNKALEGKADKTYVDGELNKKADKSDLDKKADKDAGNIEISKWQTKLGNGKNEAGNTGLITGGTLNKALEGKADKTYVDGELNKKADKSDLDKKADKDAGNIEISKWQTKLGNGKNEAGNTGLITGGTLNKALEGKADKTYVDGELNNKADKSDLDKKANKDAGNIEISKWQTKLGNGKNEAGNTGLITGGTLNKALEDVKAGQADLNGEISADNKTKGVTGDKIYYAINSMTNVLESREQARYNVLDNKINETGAESAALAALKYDNEDAKIQLAAGVGNYNGKTAYALGFKYNINNNASFHVGSTLGDGKTMINGGFSIAFGKGNKKIDVNMEKRIENMEKEINQLKQQNKELMEAIKTLLLNKNKKSTFKDVPDGHWAKEAVDVLKGNGVLEGYPDGEFKGDRTMTRYEYSQMLEKALTKK